MLARVDHPGVVRLREVQWRDGLPMLVLDAVLSDGTTVARDVRVGAAAVVRGSVLMPGCVVGPGAEVVDSVVGRDAEVGAGVRLERVTVGDGALVAASPEPGSRVDCDVRVG